MRTFQFVRRRITCTTFAVLSALLLTAASTVAESLPYETRIITPGAPVQSGPGEDFYATDTLAQGDVVEVYREERGGWLGIRPPEGSFSWMFGRHLKLLDNGVAEVDKDDVPSRIGSRLGERRNSVQVRLKKGEMVEILSKETVDGESWYKIAPPSGEFRWIHRRHVALRNDLAPTQPAEPIAPPIVTVPMTTDEPVRADTNITLVADAQPAAEQNADTSWRASPMATVDSGAQNEVVPKSADSRAVMRGSPDAARAHAEVTPVATPRPTSTAVNDGLARQLTDLELRLSRIIAEPPTAWQIAPLRLEAGQLLAGATTDAERAAVNTTIAKLDRFAAIEQRYRQVGVASPQQASVTPLGGAANPLGPDGTRYDAIGILRPVVSKRPGAPQFALVDDRGQVVSFVTATPDLNLQPYIGHRIGITGSRGFIPEFQRAHVTAGRVAPLGGRMLR